MFETLKYYLSLLNFNKLYAYRDEALDVMENRLSPSLVMESPSGKIIYPDKDGAFTSVEAGSHTIRPATDDEVKSGCSHE